MSVEGAITPLPQVTGNGVQKGLVIRVVGDAFPYHPQTDQHRREEGEQGGRDKNAGHSDASESAYAGY